MKLLDGIILGIAAFLLFVSLLNPGGIFIAAAIVFVLLGLRLLLPWLGQYIVSSHSGKKGRAQARKARRADDTGDGGQR